jgi:hypothetical protein
LEGAGQQSFGAFQAINDVSDSEQRGYEPKAGDKPTVSAGIGQHSSDEGRNQDG